MTNAEKMSKQCTYDTLCEMNRNLIKATQGEYCIMACFKHYDGGCDGNCDECIRLWRLKKSK